MNKYWRLKRDDKELDIFIDFLESSYSYKETSRGIPPSRVGHLNSNFKPIKQKETIIVTLSISSMISKSTIFSQGSIIDENNKKQPLTIRWEEDNEKTITNFSKKWLRKEKLKKINANAKEEN